MGSNIYYPKLRIFLLLNAELSFYSMLYKTRLTEFLFTLVFLYLMWGTLMTPLKAQNSSQKNFVVVLDAGHGGHDSGNRGNGYSEKDIALKIAFLRQKDACRCAPFKSWITASFWR